MKTFPIVLGVILIVGGGIGYFFYNQKQVDEAFDNKCRASGDQVKQSGLVCHYINCDHSKYSCTMF